MMKKQPKVSVIVPIYKVEKYLVQCLDSIVNQTLKDIEIILVDEGDKDACRYIIDHYEQADPRVIAIHEKNGGYGASVNKGFEIAKGEYLSIIESDDFIDSHMFEEMYNYAKKLDADVVKTPYYEYWDKTEKNNEKIQLCFWYAKTKNIDENKLFKIEDYPELLAIHPSIWSALYKSYYIKSKNICLIEAKGAGYVDNHFRIQTLCQTNKIAWLNKLYNYYRLTNENASTVHYNLGDFIQRWADVHQLFSKKFPNKWSILSSFCIKEEFINVYYRFLQQNYTLTQQQAELVKQNLAYTSEEQITSSKELTSNEKSMLLMLKKDPSIIDNYINNNKYVKSVSTQRNNKEIYKIYCFGIPLMKIKITHEKKWKYLLLGFLPIVKVIKK